VRHQDDAITIVVLQAVESILESEWNQAGRPDVKKRLAKMGAWFIAGFCSGLRGEAMLLIKLAGTARDLSFLSNEVCPHFVFIVSGQTKGNQLSGAKFGVPIAARTKGINLQPGRWVKRLIDLLTIRNDTRGRLF
jgi:hypothetical protein